MNISRTFVIGALSLTAAGQFAAVSAIHAAPVHGWLSWRGPNQNGTSLEKHLPDRIDANKPLWTADLPGQSTPVIANGRLYILGYVGEGPDLQEVIVCLDAETGKPLSQHGYRDFLSDTIYHRYATSSPTIDPETGNVYMQGTQGILAAFTADGAKLWDLSMMEVYGRLTFPNGRAAIGEGQPPINLHHRQVPEFRAVGGERRENALGALHINIAGFRVDGRAGGGVTMINRVAQKIAVAMLREWF